MVKTSVFKSGATLTLLLLVTQLSGCSASSGIKPSQATCGQFLQKMQSQQFGASYALLTSKAKAATSLKQMQNYWILIEKNDGKVLNWSQNGVQLYSGTDGSSVQLNYDLKCANGAANVQFLCVEEHGSWLIQGFNFSG